jgi:hypothetical protein
MATIGMFTLVGAASGAVIGSITGAIWNIAHNKKESSIEATRSHEAAEKSADIPKESKPPVRHSPVARHSSVAFIDPGISQFMRFSGVFNEGQLPLVEVLYVVNGPVPITHNGLHIDVSLKPIEENPALMLKKAVEDFRKRPFHDQADLVFPPGDMKRITGPFPPNPKPLTAEEAVKLNSGTLAICVIGVVHWQDESGRYETTLSRCYGRFPGQNAPIWASFPGDNVEHKR